MVTNPIIYQHDRGSIMTMMETLSAIADAVESAINLIPDLKTRGEDTGMGADGTYTSQIDKIAENTVLDYIMRHNIPLNILSEEIGFVDNDANETLVLDPIDGTSNAIAGVPLFTISMAIGKEKLSDVHTAYLRNLVTGDVMYAEKGKGAFKNGIRMHAKKNSDLKDLFVMIYLGNGAHPDSFALAKRVRSSRSYGCASIEMELVAEGESDAYLMYAEKYSRSIRVVDIAASILLLREAGGDAYDLEGNVLEMPFNLEYRSNFIAFGDPKVYDFIMKKDKKSVKPKYGISVNSGIPNKIEYTKRVLNALKGEDVIMDSDIAKELGFEGCDVENMDVDIMISIGGDGTILRTLMKNDAPLIGINAGGVGFLAEIDIEDIESGMDKLRHGEYTIEERFKLSSWYDGKYLSEAVNEVVVHTDSVAKIRQYRIYVNDELVTEVRADGVIISTPTGSTCYAMSLGAPILDPRVNAFVIVPMAAYKFASRPFVVPADAKITVESVLERGCLLVVDGQTEYEMPGKTSVDLTKSNNVARFIRFDTDFYTRVREKLVNAI